MCTGLENRRLLVRSLAQPIFFQRTDDCNSDRINSSLTAVHCFDNVYVGNHPVAWKEYCVECWLNRSAGRRNIVVILLKTALNTIQSINQLNLVLISCFSTSGNVFYPFKDNFNYLFTKQQIFRLVQIQSISRRQIQ